MAHFTDRLPPQKDGMSINISHKPKFEDGLDKPTGIFSCYVRNVKTGKILDKYTEENIIVNVAKNTLARLIGGDVTGKSVAKISVGTNSSAASPSDTAITNKFVKNVSGHTYPSDGRVRFTWIFDTSEANGKEVWEFGLECADESLFARKVRPNHPIYKDEEIEIEGTWEIIL